MFPAVPSLFGGYIDLRVLEVGLCLSHNFTRSRLVLRLLEEHVR
jgi:hypothetical protein